MLHQHRWNTRGRSQLYKNYSHPFEAGGSTAVESNNHGSEVFRKYCFCTGHVQTFGFCCFVLLCCETSSYCGAQAGLESPKKPSVVCHYSQGDMNKHLLIPDGKPMRGQSKDATKVQFVKPVSLIRVIYRTIGKRLVTSLDVTPRQLYHPKATLA